MTSGVGRATHFRRTARHDFDHGTPTRGEFDEGPRTREDFPQEPRVNAWFRKEYFDTSNTLTGVEDHVPVRMADGGVCHS